MGIAMNVVWVRRLACARPSSYWDIYTLHLYKIGRSRTSAPTGNHSKSPESSEDRPGFILENSRILPTDQVPETVAGDKEFSECSVVTSEVLLWR